MNAKQLLKKIKKELASFSWIKQPERVITAEKLDVSRTTIDNYIKGQVADMIFAEELIKELGKVPKPKNKRKARIKKSSKAA